MGTELQLYKIDPDYLRYMHSIDYRISVKYNSRPFVGIITMVNGINYVIPLTSKTSDMRAAEGRARRSSRITSYIRDSKGTEIAILLHNNMFPVKDGVYARLEINGSNNTYQANEIRYIRKHAELITAKATRVYHDRTTRDDPFLNNICCDFKKLERVYMNFKP